MDDDICAADGNLRSNALNEKADDDETVNLSVSKSKSVLICITNEIHLIANLGK